MAMKLGGTTIFGFVGGIGAYALLNRIDKAVRPKTRFVLAEIGIAALKVSLSLEASDICYRVAKDAAEGLKNGTDKILKDRAEKEESEDTNDGIHLHVVKNTAEDRIDINDFGKWLKEREEKGIFEDGNE